jgi:Ca-activated chloride channel homolog
MRFGNPVIAVYIFWVIPFIALFWIFAVKGKRAALNRFVGKALWKDVAASFSRRREYAVIAVLSISFLLLLVALAQPRMGFKWRQIKQEGIDIIFAVDTSRSMLAEDITPSRIERAKMEISGFMDRLTGDRVGLVAFAGEAFLQCPLTLDYDGFRVMVSALDADIIPTGGTNIAEGIRESIQSFEPGRFKHRVIVLISDGEDHEKEAVKAAGEAGKENIRIFCIGVGTPEGTFLSVSDNAGKREFIKDSHGRNVLSRLNEPLLKEIAFATEGSYVRSSAIDFGLNSIYNDKISKMQKSGTGEMHVKQYNEYFQILIFIAVILLIAEMFISRKNV